MPETYTTFITSAELAARLDDPGWIVMDCRTDLAKPEWGWESYRTGHIPGAVYADLNRDLSNPITPDSGRHPLPDSDAIAERLGRLGIGDGMQVVAYDTAFGSYAARLWCLLRLIGHREVAVLAGDFNRWQQDGRPVEAGEEKRTPAILTARPTLISTVDSGTVADLAGNPNYRLIDARSPERYSGENEIIDTIAGHIPGAANRFHGENYDPAGVLKPPQQLRAEFENILAGLPPQHSIVYCGSGVTSCLHLIAMEYAGLPGSALYAGSWSEWIRDPNRPVATGPNP